VKGHAILFATSPYAKIPADIPENVALSMLDVCGAPAKMKELSFPNARILLIGGGGKSGLLSAWEAKKVPGVYLAAVEPTEALAEKARKTGLFDQVIVANAQDPVACLDRVHRHMHGKLPDLVVNVANVPETEMASILCCRPKGIVYFFSMATNFQRAALGSEGVGADVDLRIGNGFTPGHAELTLQIYRDSKVIRELFNKHYAT
jgi:L-erythro-3,5-diaminohexanoate dehydrogenase